MTVAVFLTMSTPVIAVFGGTGFLGRRVVRHLREHEFSVRIASRHPDRSRQLFGCDDPQLQSVEADVHDERAVADVLARAYGVVNAAWRESRITPSRVEDARKRTYGSLRITKLDQEARRGTRSAAGPSALPHNSYSPCQTAQSSSFPRRVAAPGFCISLFHPPR
jgi:NAD(P)-dependent dehydrogenase (short-subunit alcohol dehydrogenase family)